MSLFVLFLTVKYYTVIHFYCREFEPDKHSSYVDLDGEGRM